MADSALERPRRVEFFDVAKAIAIIAVICGHTAIRYLGLGRGASLVFATCFTFHLPLFFFVSGYFLHTDRPFDVRREAKSLLVPYVVTALAVVVGVCATNLVFHDWGSTRHLFWQWLSAAVYAAGDIPANPLWSQEVRIGAIWFLPALFWARLTVSLAYRTRVPALVVAGAFIGGIWSATLVFLPFDVQSGLCASSFVYLGTLARSHRLFDRGTVPPWAWILLALVWLLAIKRFQAFGMAMCSYGLTPSSTVLNIAGGIAGTLCVLGACMAIERHLPKGLPWKTLCLVGTTTLPIMCVHLFEDDVVRWGWVVDATVRMFGAPSFGWLAVLVVRVVLDCAIAVALMRIPVVSWVFGGSKR